MNKKAKKAEKAEKVAAKGEKKADKKAAKKAAAEKAAAEQAAKEEEQKQAQEASSSESEAESSAEEEVAAANGKDNSEAESDNSNDSDSDSDESDSGMKGSDSEGTKRKVSSDVEMDDSDSDDKEPAAPPAMKKQKTDSAGEVFPVFVGNLPFSATSEVMKDVFSEYGEVSGARVATHPDGKARGFGYVDYATEEARDKALNASYVEIDGRQLRLDKANSTARDSKEPRSKPATEPSKVLFMGNLSFHSTEDSIRAAFAECGNVVSVRLVTDRDTGRPKGFGYLEFESVEAATSALEWNGSDLDGRNIRLDFSAPRQNNGGGGGGGGRGGRGGRGGGGRGGRFGGAANRRW
ncbi:hypothetical protein GGF46_000720 [Coemansia sp. RSA 552]|nr:hypothetical protein GGF46_000720 [Coemansia sp. RSA 552]